MGNTSTRLTLPLSSAHTRTRVPGSKILISDAAAGEIGGYLCVLPDLIRCAVREGNGHTAALRGAETYQPVGTDDHIILRHFVICRDIYQQKIRRGLRRQLMVDDIPGTQPCVNRLAGFDGASASWDRR